MLNSATLPIVLAGSVGSSRRVLQGLLRHRANVVGILGLAATKANNVSGYTRLDDLAIEANIPYVEFTNINSSEIQEIVRNWTPDLFFVVGLSQIVKKELMAIPRLGCVGFHPTWLPEGRGRAPVAWLTLEGRPGAATLFLMDEGTDSGPILAQQPFYVSDHDYASDVIEKLERAIDSALDQWLPTLLAGHWEPQPQSKTHANYNGKRGPEDGLIDWRMSAKQIYALIRATSRPHPGAYTYLDGHKVIIWRAEIITTIPHRGVIGRVICTSERGELVVQTGDGLLRLSEIEILPISDAQSVVLQLKVGQKLGMNCEDEIHLLTQKLRVLEKQINQLNERAKAE